MHVLGVVAVVALQVSRTEEESTKLIARFYGHLPPYPPRKAAHVSGIRT